MSSTRMLSAGRRRSSAPSSATNQNSQNPPPFSETSGIHGVGRTAQGATSLRALYAILLTLALVVTVICLTYTIIEVASDPSYVKTRVHSRLSLELPKITFCNLNPLRLSSLPDFEEYIDNRDGNEAEIEAVYFGSGLECAFCVDGRIDPDLFRDEYTQLPSNLKAAYGHQIDQMLLSCKFLGATCSSDDFTTYVDDFYGNCFTFDPQNSSQYVSEAGSEKGLILELNLETEEYVSPVSETSGARLLIESKDTTYCSRRTEVVVSPGKDSFLGMKSSISTDSCTSQTLSSSTGEWPVSSDYSSSLVSMATTQAGTDSSVTTTDPVLDSSTIIPTIEDIEEGSGGGFEQVPSLIEADDYLLSINEREVSELVRGKRATFSDEVENGNERESKSNMFPKRSFLEGEETLDTPKETFDAPESNEYLSKHREGLPLEEEKRYLNQNIKHHKMETIEEDSPPRFEDFYGENLLLRVRRQTIDEATNSTDSSSNSNSTSSTESAVDEARRRFAKLRVFYDNLDEEVETRSPVYPWFVVIALIGGQMALFCSLSVVAIAEAVEHGLRKVGGCLKRNNQVDVQPAW